MRTDAPMFLLLDDAAVTWLTPARKTEPRARHPQEAGEQTAGTG